MILKVTQDVYYDEKNVPYNLRGAMINSFFNWYTGRNINCVTFNFDELVLLVARPAIEELILRYYFPHQKTCGLYKDYCSREFLEEKINQLIAKGKLYIK